MQELWKIPSEPRNNLVKVGSQENVDGQWSKKPNTVSQRRPFLG